jgi:NAD(P)-dependent dehydrogenase (short-subunit alcohol dehydrogenase family)
MKGLKGKCAIITGGTTGIGLATAIRLVEENCKVGIIDLNPIILNDEHIKLYQHIHFVKCDITNDDEILLSLSITQLTSFLKGLTQV